MGALPSSYRGYAMKIVALIASGACLISLGACNRTPAENKADKIEAAAENKADVLDQKADNASSDVMENRLQNQAENIRETAENKAEAVREGAPNAVGNATNTQR
jgi:hypothetical protein